METLQTLDKLEGHPEKYTRDTLMVALHSSPDDLVQCDAYLMKNARRDLLTSEALIADYRDTPERRYVLPTDRDKTRATDVVMGMKERDAA